MFFVVTILILLVFDTTIMQMGSPSQKYLVKMKLETAVRRLLITITGLVKNLIFSSEQLLKSAKNHKKKTISVSENI